jgi:adenine-specific DNA methylase
MTKSIKPTRDGDKIIADAYRSFWLQTKKMIKKNGQFWKIIGNHKVDCVVDNTDARALNLRNESTTLIITSPPYVTSYEYADLHQLSALWFKYTSNMKEFRSKFIGSVQKKDNNKADALYSSIAKEIVCKLLSKDCREGRGVYEYFLEMQQVFKEMYRILKRHGRVCIIIGNTDLKKVGIKNAEVFIETMEKVGFHTHEVIKRPIPSKILPLTRDARTGKFIAAAKADRLSYPTEYILIMQKE